MPVSDDRAFALLRTFGQLEYQLKRRQAFLRADRWNNAMVDWRAVERTLLALPPRAFVSQLSPLTKRKVLAGARNRPKVQVVEAVAGGRKARFVFLDLDRTEARAMIQAARRVRNNLFHGGKEDPGNQPFDGDDEEWAQAALDVAQVVLDLVHEGLFGEAEPPHSVS